MEQLKVKVKIQWGILEATTLKKNDECKNNFKVGKVERKNSIDWNQTNSILIWNQGYSESIHVDTNHTDLNQLNSDDLANIGSIHDSDNIRAIENILASPAHSPVHASPIFNYRSASDPPSPPHDWQAETVIPKGNPMPHDNPHNMVP